MKIHTSLIFPFFTFSSSKCFWGFQRKDYSCIGEYYECLKAWPVNATMYAIEMAFLDATQCGSSQHLYLGGQDLGTYLGTIP